MGSLVTQTSANALAAYGGQNPWAEAARGVETGAYLKFNGNTGEITFGSDDTELPVGSQLVVDMQTLAFGWICWVDSQVEEEVFRLVTDGKPPMEHELTDHGPYNDPDDGWREAASFSAVILEYGDGPDSATDEAVGTQLLFKTSTGGPVRSTRKLSGAYGKSFMQHPGELPVVELQTESYIPKQKKHGKKWSLIFKIVGWISEAELEGLTVGGGDNDDDYEPEPAPKQVTSRRQPEPEPEPEVVEEEEPAPAPRTRRGAAPAEVDEDVAPAPRGRSPGRRGAAAAPAEEAEEEAPAPRSRRAAAAPAEEPEEEAPAPARRAAPAGGARTRRFA
ncbi:hypothetical protein LAV_00049 [Sphingobium phage Lacusarx]|uniref:Uncharacterized protein n=1 Tax=Sphingobium phage Lacusarx TaxID=1980139 RepID=A0A1W6DX36_9CAUD|nr:nucleotidyltransferase [Sphingobium phage Lacusarx]ARK07449.1 hypothetical protein LAV_00049 [Sphingobium phage Lacusarx]